MPVADDVDHGRREGRCDAQDECELECRATRVPGLEQLATRVERFLPRRQRRVDGRSRFGLGLGGRREVVIP